MKTAVIYQSASGFTKKYAQWIAGELSADLFARGEIAIDALSEYDCIIYGGSLHASGIRGIDIITKNFPRLAKKKIIVFAVGASPARENIPEEICSHNFSPQQREALRFFYFRGGFDLNKLGFLDKMLMKMLKWKILSKRDRSPDEQGMLAAMTNPVDFTDKNSIKPLIDYVRSMR